MQKFDIGWIPYNIDLRFNHYSHPTKFFEYCALGLPVLTTPLLSLQEYKNNLFFFSNQLSFKKQISIITSKNQAKISKQQFEFASDQAKDKIPFILQTCLREGVMIE